MLQKESTGLQEQDDTKTRDNSAYFEPSTNVIGINQRRSLPCQKGDKANDYEEKSQ